MSDTDTAPGSNRATMAEPDAAPQLIQTVDTPEGRFAISFAPTPQSTDEDGAPEPRPTSLGQPVASSAGGQLRDGGGGFFGQLEGIPIEYLIATPLVAAARGNIALATVMTEFINEIAFDGDKTRVASFDLTREVQDPVTKKFAPQTITVNAPLLALVPIPALLVQSVTIDLTVEISSKVSDNSSSSEKVDVSISDSWGFGSASFSGSYSSSQSHTRETDQSAKYEVTVIAQQQPVPEGMSKLMDVFASTIVPIPADKS